MKREEVESSVLKSVGYNKEKKLLEAEIVTGEVYEYYEVPLWEYEALMQSESLGGFYNTHIKKHRCNRVK